MKKTIFFIVGSIIFLIGLYSGYLLFKKPDALTQVNSEVILTMLKSEGFLVSQTFIFNQQVTIDKSSGSEWKDIFWGQTITAFANIKVNSGVDLADLQPQDVKITPENIVISLPPIEEESIELLGDITLQNKQGILKKIFDNDSGYNTAYARLKAEAQKAASQEDLRQEARVSAEKQLIRLLQLIQPDKRILIEFRS